MTVDRPSCRRPLALVVSPTRNAASPFGRSHAVCVSFADPERAPEADADLIARLYGLTAREAAVAALLLQGPLAERGGGRTRDDERTPSAPTSATSSTRPAWSGSPTSCGFSCRDQASADVKRAFAQNLIGRSHQFW